MHRTRVIWARGESIVVEDELNCLEIADRLVRNGFHPTLRVHEASGDEIRYVLMREGVPHYHRKKTGERTALYPAELRALVVLRSGDLKRHTSETALTTKPLT